MIPVRVFDNAADLIKSYADIRRGYFPSIAPARRKIAPPPLPPIVETIKPPRHLPPHPVLTGIEDRIPLRNLIKIVASFYFLTVNDLKSPSRLGHIVRARQHFFYLAAVHTKWSMCKIARFVNRDHTTGFWGVLRYCQANNLPLPRNSQFKKRMPKWRSSQV